MWRLHPRFEIDEEAGIDRERLLGVDRDRVDDALAVTDRSERDETEYVRNAELDE